MSVVMTGLEYQRFVTDDKFWESDYVDDEEILVDGVDHGDSLDPDAIAPTAKVEIKSGHMITEKSCYRGSGDSRSYVEAAKAWMKSQKTTILIVEVDKASAMSAKNLIESSFPGSVKVIGESQ